MDEEIKTILTEELDKFKETVKESVTETVNAAIKAREKDFISNEDLQKVLEDNGISKDVIVDITKAIEDNGAKILQIKEKGAKETMNVIQKVLTENKEAIEKFAKGDIKDMKFVIKAAGENALSDVTTPYQGQIDPNISQIQRRDPFLIELFNQVPLTESESHGYYRYTEQTTQTDGSTRVAESGAYPSTTKLTWTGKNIQIEKIGDLTKLTKEVMKFAPRLEADVRKFINDNLTLKNDYYALKGTGSSQPYGVEARATAYAAGSYANQYQDANLMDLIRVCKTLIKTGTRFMPDYGLLNPLDFETKLMGKKDDNNNYVFAQNGGMVALIGGVIVITNSGVTANTMTVGDFKRGDMLSGQGIELEFGYDSDDFSNDLVSLKGNSFWNLLIRTNDQDAFRYVSDIDAAITVLIAA